MAGRPALGVVEEGAHPADIVARQPAVLLGGRQHVPPGREPVQGDSELGVTLHGLATWWDVLAAAEEAGRLARDDLARVRAFLDNPEGWSAGHGGRTTG